MDKPIPVAMRAEEAPLRPPPPVVPPAFAHLFAGREKRPLGDLFGLTNFGVNLTRLAPGGVSSLRHAHARQDEFIYVLDGTPTLITNTGETPLSPGMCAGFRAGTGNAHHLVNRSETDVIYLEIGDRAPADVVTYPDDDVHAEMAADGTWHYMRKNGQPL